MATGSIQDRTAEFRAVLAQAQKNRNQSRVGVQRQSLLTDAQRQAANGSPNGDAKVPRKGTRSEFARKAAEIGRGITGTMEKLERLAQCMSSPSPLPSECILLQCGTNQCRWKHLISCVRGAYANSTSRT